MEADANHTQVNAFAHQAGKEFIVRLLAVKIHMALIVLINANVKPVNVVIMCLVNVFPAQKALMECDVLKNVNVLKMAPPYAYIPLGNAFVLPITMAIGRI